MVACAFIYTCVHLEIHVYTDTYEITDLRHAFLLPNLPLYWSQPPSSLQILMRKGKSLTRRLSSTENGSRVSVSNMFIVQWQHRPSTLLHTQDASFRMHDPISWIQRGRRRKEFEGCSEEAIGLYSKGSVAKEDRMWPYIFQKVRDSPAHGPHTHVCKNNVHLNIHIAQNVCRVQE